MHNVRFHEGACMQTSEARVGIDSNVLSYLATAMSGEYDPTADASELRDERVAVYRAFVYGRAIMCVTPTVKSECANVPENRLKTLHDGISNVLLLDGPWNFDDTVLAHRVAEFLPCHSDANDCQILAEAEQAGFVALLTFDTDFIKHLAGRSAGPLLSSPSAHLQRLAISPGTRTIREPVRGNPMRMQDWWKV